MLPSQLAGMLAEHRKYENVVTNCTASGVDNLLVSVVAGHFIVGKEPRTDVSFNCFLPNTTLFMAL